jgi:hypothetical protein
VERVREMAVEWSLGCNKKVPATVYEERRFLSKFSVGKERCYCAGMTDDQYRSLMIHIRALIVLLRIIAGIPLAFAWMYL